MGHGHSRHGRMVVRGARPSSGGTRRIPVPPLGSQPHALTFFLTLDQRRAVLARLHGAAATRADALLATLGISAHHAKRASTKQKGGRR